MDDAFLRAVSSFWYLFVSYDWQKTLDWFIRYRHINPSIDSYHGKNSKTVPHFLVNLLCYWLCGFSQRNSLGYHETYGRGLVRSLSGNSHLVRRDGEI